MSAQEQYQSGLPAEVVGHILSFVCPSQWPRRRGTGVSDAQHLGIATAGLDRCIAC